MSFNIKNFTSGFNIRKSAIMIGVGVAVLFLYKKLRRF